MKILAGSANPILAKNIANQLGTSLVNCEISYFSNGEKKIQIMDEVKGENVAIVQSFVDPVDERVIETLLMIDALERMGVRHISLVIPWMGYSLQDKVFQPGEPISAKVIAKLISNSYVKRVFLMDLHNDSIPGFFDIPTHYLSASSVFEEYLKEKIDLNQAVIVSPDFGGLKRARTFAKKLGLPLANIDKTRDLNTGEVTAVALHGEVKGKDAIVLDDVIVSGSTVVEVADCLKKAQAKQVLFMASHGLLTKDAQQKIEDSLIDKVVFANTIEHQSLTSKHQLLDVSEIFANQLLNWK